MYRDKPELVGTLRAGITKVDVAPEIANVLEGLQAAQDRLDELTRVGALESLAQAPSQQPIDIQGTAYVVDGEEHAYYPALQPNDRRKIETGHQGSAQTLTDRIAQDTDAPKAEPKPDQDRTRQRSR